MLTTVPWEEFVALTKGVKEDGDTSKKPFRWDQMLKYRKSFKYLNKYISETDCKFVGEGSARTAYFLPVGAYDTKYLNEPSCFKVAKDSKKGVAQNKAEVNILDRFGANGRNECFPKLYDWDGDDFHFMLCEIGTPLENVPDNDADKYFDEWNPWIKKHYPKYYSRLSIKEPSYIFDLLEYLLDAISDGSNKADAEKAVIQEIGKDIPKYAGIGSFLTFMFDKGGVNDVLFGDFLNPNNWGFVSRDNVLTMIPIDWGFTKEVAEKWY